MTNMTSRHVTPDMLLQAMAAAAPQQLQQATRQPVEKLLSGNQAEDKARTCAAIELLCGLIASGQIFGPEGGASLLSSHHR